MGNCSQCVGRDCGFKYQKYCGLNKEELDDYLREKIKTKYGIQCSERDKDVFIAGISEKPPEFEEDSVLFDQKSTKNRSHPQILVNEPLKMDKSFEAFGERCETKKLDNFRDRFLHNTKFPEEMKHLVIKPILLEPSKEKSPILSASSPGKSPDHQKTPDNRKFEFQNKIFDLKEIQSPNLLFKDYGNIFNEEDDDISEGEMDKETKTSKSRLFIRRSNHDMKLNNEKAA